MPIANRTQVPLYEPIYINGAVSNVWVMFFQKLAQLANKAETSGDLLELMQLANQLPSNAQQAQLRFEMSEFNNTFSAVPIAFESSVEIPPVTAVFLCLDDVFPLNAVESSSQGELLISALPSSEIIHD